MIAALQQRAKISQVEILIRFEVMPFSRFAEPEYTRVCGLHIFPTVTKMTTTYFPR